MSKWTRTEMCKTIKEFKFNNEVLIKDGRYCAVPMSFLIDEDSEYAEMRGLFVIYKYCNEIQWGNDIIRKLGRCPFSIQEEESQEEIHIDQEIQSIWDKYTDKDGLILDDNKQKTAIQEIASLIEKYDYGNRYYKDLYELGMYIKN